MSVENLEDRALLTVWFADFEQMQSFTPGAINAQFIDGRLLGSGDTNREAAFALESDGSGGNALRVTGGADPDASVVYIDSNDGPWHPQTMEFDILDVTGGQDVNVHIHAFDHVTPESYSVSKSYNTPGHYSIDLSSIPGNFDLGLIVISQGNYYGTSVSYLIDNIQLDVTTVRSVTANDLLLTDSDAGSGTFNVVVVFDQAMDTTATPTLIFAPAVASTLSLTGGVWSNSDQTYTATYNVSDANVNVSNITIDVTGAKNAAGNAQDDYTPSSDFRIDTTNPTVSSATMSDSALKIGDTSTLTIIFSEAVTAFDNSDVTTPNGMLTALATTDGVTWTGTFTPTANTEVATNVVSVAASYTDLAGNSGSAGTSANYAIDTKAPTVSSATMSDSALKIGDTSTLTIIFSEAVTGFDNSDVTTPNGTLSTLTTTDGVTWTGTFTPTANTAVATNVVSVAASYTDVAGNSGSTGTSANYAIDTIRPTVDIVDVTPDPRASEVSSINITFSESVSNVDIGDFTLTRTVGAVTSPVSLTTAVLSGSGTAYNIAGLMSLTNSEGTYTLTLASSGTGITDAAGNEQNTGASDDWLFLSTTITPSGIAPNKTLTITDVGGVGNIGNTSDDIIVKLGPADPITHISTTVLITVEGKELPFSLDGVSTLVFDAGFGNDKLTLDFSNGPLPFNVTFNGGTGGNDSLVIHNGGAYGLLNTTYANRNDGLLAFSLGGTPHTVTFTGLEPITIDGTPTQLIFNLPNTNDTGVTLSVIAGGFLRLAGTTFETTDFNPTDVTSITINGNGGNDNITIGNLGTYGGTLTVDGGSGTDTVNASGSSIGVTLLGGAGNDTLTGSGSKDSLGGDSGNDNLKGGSENDTLSGGSGDDVLDGDGGNDSYAESVTGSVTITNTKLIGGNIGTDVRISLESIEFSGDSGNNLLDASQYTLGAVTLRGNDGNDTLLGGSGDDLLDGGSGIDVVKQTSLKNQTLTGGLLTGNGVTGDTLTSIERADLTARSAGGNTVDASLFNGRVTLTGGNGPDTLWASIAGSAISGGSGKDTILGGFGADSIDGGTDNDSITGGDGLDTLFGGTGRDYMDGGTGADVINGGTGRDTIFGGDGNDTIDGGAEDDIISGGQGHDTITGGIGNDAISGGAGNDFIDGQGGNDTLLGDAGADTLRGGAGRDACLGGDGTDNIDGGLDRDTLTGTQGVDVFGTPSEIDNAFTFDFNKLLV